MILSTLKTSELSFCSKFKIYFLMVSNLELAFKIIRPIIFPAIKKISFPQSRNFSTVKELFQSQRNFSTVKELFHNHVSFTQSESFSTVVKIFHSPENVLQNKFT